MTQSTHKLSRTTTGGWLTAAACIALSASGLATAQEVRPAPGTTPAAVRSAVDEARIDALIAKLTLEEKIRMLAGSRGYAATGVARLDIPAFTMTDGPAGAKFPPPSTAYAAGIGLAAAWDRDLAREVGVQLGRDARSRGAQILLGPGVNIYRAPMNGRNYEYFGEDPYLAGEVAVGYIAGVQSQGVSATIKHYAANNSEYLRNTSDSVVGERALREIYLPAFEAGVRKAHVGAIMDSYNLVNGSHATQSKYLNLDVAKRQWGFDGIIMSDWGATHDGVAAANAGLDLEMPNAAFMNESTLLPAIKSGKVSIATIDDKVRRILRLGYRFGWMDTDARDIAIPRYNQQGRAAALQTAREGLVLLRNQGNLLPLDPRKVKTIAVIGPNAYPAMPTAGGSGQVSTFGDVSVLKGISDRLGLKGNVLYDRGIAKLAVMASRSGFTQVPGKAVPGMKVESFDNADYAGKPIGTSVVALGSAGKGPFGGPEMADIMTDLMMRVSAEQLMMAVASGTTFRAPRYDRWTGYYAARAAGDFVAFVEHQGRYRLKIDDKVVIDHSEFPKYALAQRSVPLPAGDHKVVLELLDRQGGDPIVKLGIVERGQFVDQAAIDMARKADVVILAVGYDAEVEGEGYDHEFGLPPGQEELIAAITAANPNTIVTVTAGSSVDASRWVDRVAGLLHNWYPGQEGGTALAEVIFGDVNPSGRLPVSWDRTIAENPSFASYYPTPGTLKIPYKDDIFVGYRGYEQKGVKPLFPFGFGLSYTSFRYSGLKVRPGPAAGEYEVSFAITNTGKVAGADVAQLYISEDKPQAPRPPQELKGFARAMLKPGETRRVAIPLDARSFSWFDEKAAAWRADAGSFTVRVSRSSADPQLEGKITLPRAIIQPVE